ncbi:MAG TPA: DivIVA domain-containing protein [Gemmatimonadales bacterium]|jgi:DivIVA domain-containing protein|nr:DivIVA domain-containing protein [Gemmatimonadales bacterium]
MTDDAFHLTSHDVRAQEFQRALRGYDISQVDEFKQRMAEEIDRLVRDRVQLDERVKGMSEQLKSYRDRERAMNDALVAAQQLRNEAQVQMDREREVSLREAETQAERVLLEAHMEAERLLQHARAESQRLAQGNELARRQFQGYLASFRQLLERELSEVAALAAESSAAESGETERELRRQA